MRVDGSLAMLDRWGRAALPGAVLLFFVLLTLAPLRAPYLSDALPLLPVLIVFQFSLATPERLPGLLLLVMGVLLDLLLGKGSPSGMGSTLADPWPLLVRSTNLARTTSPLSIPYPHPLGVVPAPRE